MAEQVKSGLLPVGETIDFNNQQLKIERILGQGATAEVYKAILLDSLGDSMPVAVKVLNPWGFSFSKKDFETEMESLRFLMDYEKEANVESNTDIKVCPVYYGRGTYEDAIFFVMELIDGQQLPDLLFEKGHMLEQKSTQVAWLLFRTLGIFHKKLERYYSDFKLSNLWWVESDNPWNGQLKLMDLGSLELVKTDDRKTQQDVITAAVHVFRIAAGVDLKYTRLKIKDHAESEINRSSLSWGFKRLLHQMLHRTRSARETDAQVIAEKFSHLAHFWTLDQSALLNEINSLLNKAESGASEFKKDSEEYSSAWLARAGISIWLAMSNQHESVVEDQIERAEKIISKMDIIRQGEENLKMGDFLLAEKLFEKAVDSSEKIDLARRWLYLFRAIKDIAPEYKDNAVYTAFKVIDNLSKADYSHAKERIESLRSASPAPENLNYLIAEANYFEEDQKAESYENQDDFQNAAEALRRCQNWLDQIPSKEYLEKEYGSIQDRLEEIEIRRDTRGKAIAAMEKFRSQVRNRNWKVAVRTVEEIYRIAPDFNDGINDYVSAAETMISIGALSQAYRICEIGTRISKEKQLFKLKNIAFLIQRGKAIADTSDYRKMVDFLHTYSDLLASTRLSQPYFAKWLSQSAAQAVRDKNTKSLEFVYDMTGKLNATPDFRPLEIRNQVEKVLQETEKENEVLAEDLVSEASALISFDRDFRSLRSFLRGADLDSRITELIDRKERMSKADRLLMLAENLSQKLSKRERIIQLKSQIAFEKEKFERAIPETQKLLKQQEDTKLRFLSEQADSLRKKMEKAEDGKELVEQVRILIAQSYAYLQNVRSTDETAISLLEEAAGWMDQLSPSWWISHAENKEEETTRILKILQEAQVMYQQGEVHQAIARLNQIANAAMHLTAWNKAKVRFLSGFLFMRFMESHAEIISQKHADAAVYQEIRTYANMDIPIAYWHKTRVHNYLFKSVEKLRETVLGNRGAVNTERYFENLKLWIDGKQTILALNEKIAQSEGKKNGK
jgi:hypothetical protein